MGYVPKILFVVVVCAIGTTIATREEPRQHQAASPSPNGPTREAWAREVGELCRDVDTVVEQHAFVDRLERVERPLGDDRVDRWVQLQRQARSLARAYASARHGGTRDDARRHALRLVEIGGRDREAARGLGLPEACLSAPAGTSVDPGTPSASLSRTVE